MPRRKARMSLPLSLEMTAARARELTEWIPIGANFAREMRNCGGRCCKDADGKTFPSHGPYWRAHFRRGGKALRESVRNEALYREILAAHAFIEAERERLIPEALRAIDAWALADDCRPEVSRLVPPPESSARPALVMVGGPIAAPARGRVVPSPRRAHK